MQKIILFYKFTLVADPAAIRLWQRALCEKLNLKGRVLIAQQGINGTLGGDITDLKAYIKDTKAHQAFGDIVFKWSDGGRDDFPKLIVKVRPEIVTFGTADKINVDHGGIIGGGQRLKPRQIHELVKKHGGEVVFFDGRNAHEAAVGRFKNAVIPEVGHTRDFARELADPRYDAIKNKPVVTYCTGGVRCEVLSVLMKQHGFTEVYQLDGGIVKYGEEYGDSGLWEGALYVFDGRVTTKFSDKAVDIGDCIQCGAKTSHYENCANKTCNKLILICNNCHAKTQTCQEAACQKLNMLSI